MAIPLLDTNVLLRHLTGDHTTHSPRATELIARIEAGEVTARITDVVVFETVYTLQRLYRETRTAIRDALLPLIELPGILLAGKQRWRAVFDVYVNNGRLSLADSFHVAIMQQLRIDIISFDPGFDDILGVTRIEP